MFLNIYFILIFKILQFFTILIHLIKPKGRNILINVMWAWNLEGIIAEDFQSYSERVRVKKFLYFKFYSTIYIWLLIVHWMTFLWSVFFILRGLASYLENKSNGININHTQGVSWPTQIVFRSRPPIHACLLKRFVEITRFRGKAGF